ncbi:4231_t:CDS:2 [Ambispora leptoticha]|uniref:4231_t:CDS:1 n=1 Tax=Ambispora leptoticha TaxID=144679 RepID=A0A9N8WQZ5_9GLOM|nr:4231_t:CDS:2 [Ambispora leptoticha]
MKSTNNNCHRTNATTTIIDPLNMIQFIIKTGPNVKNVCHQIAEFDYQSILSLYL